MATTSKTSNTVDRELEAIAQEILMIPTLETRKSDSLDFHDLAVWTLKDALQAAYELGRNAR